METGRLSRMTRAAALLVFLAACGGALGDPVDVSQAIPLAEALALPRPAEVTLRGEVQEVCRSSGCWFVLRETSGADFADLYVDLQPRASFRLDASAVGHTAVVSGTLVGEGPDSALHAAGLRLE